MKVVFVHGMRQEGKNSDALRKEWSDSLTQGWRGAGLEAPDASYELPFYGDLLDALTKASLRKRDALIGATDLEFALMREYAAQQGISSNDVRTELGEEVVAKGPGNWEWVQATARLLDEKLPGLGARALRMVEQVNAYLTEPEIRRAVNDKVAPHFAGASLIVAHSLGTIVAYAILRSSTDVKRLPLLVTLGSPLGIAAVKRHLVPPKLAFPASVEAWINGTDERDYVALQSSLTKETFVSGITNITNIENRKDDAHIISDYLCHPAIARATWKSLRA